MNNIEQIRKDVKDMINSFDSDPADTAYQEGYLAALQDIYEMLRKPNENNT